MTTEATDTLESLESQHRANQLRMDIRVQEAQMRSLDRALSLEASQRSFGSAGPQDQMEGLYDPSDYVDVAAYRRENYGYQAYAATYTTKTDRKDGRNWPYWVSEPELSAIRGTVRLLAAYNKTCIGVLKKLRNYTIGKGFTRKVVDKNGSPKRLRLAIEAILDEFDTLNKIAGDMDQEVLIRDIRDGEAYLGLWHGGDGHVDLRTVEPDQISEPTNKRELEDWLISQGGVENNNSGSVNATGGLPFASNWSFGVHATEGDTMALHGYYVQWDNGQDQWDYLPAGNQPCFPPADGVNTWCEAHKSNTDRVIKRGVSDFWPVTGDIELARKLIRNLTHAGALQSAIAWIREMAPGTTAAQINSNTMASADWSTNIVTQNGGQRTTSQVNYLPGTTLHLGSNQKFTPPPWVQQTMASGLVEIFEAMLRSIAQVWSMPEHFVTGSAENNNLASILEAGAPFVKEVETRQQWHVNLWTAIYWRVVWFNWKAGRFGNIAWRDLKAAVDIKLTAPQVDVRDRFRETQRSILLVDAGLLSPMEAAAREGLDYDEQVKHGAKPRQVPISAAKAVGASGMGHSQPMTAEGPVQESERSNTLAQAAGVNWWKGYP